ncbi:unnamed protein product [Arctia plantaginis]|uniref:Uncharacterized protein n=1 Tax=Arctia plantaginis TaxID=874455 RepID=A0A8S1A611_ARCPL|nr:unnamed protein product [Arctia plantaginis]CAB3247327.1 unnamed protein product [Arctia plantaginis]
MLCLVLVACWSYAIAEGAYLSPSNNSQSKEESSFTSTISVDPWSPIVGDTEGVPSVTARVESVHGRRAAISLVENIRRQLMRDNYDYISDESKEPSTIKTPSPSQDNSKRITSARKTSIQTGMIPTSSPRAFHTSPAVAPITTAVVPRRETRLLPPLSVKQKLSPIQVARVNMPSKSNSKQHFGSFSNSPILRSLDEESHRHATTTAKNIKSEIDVSKKDLLYYMDDIHLRRNNPPSTVSSIVGRRTYEPANMTNKITINERKQNRLPTQKTKMRISVKEKHSDVKQISNYDFNQNNRRNNQLEFKTQNHQDDEHEAVEAERNGQVNVPAKHDRRHNNIQDDNDIDKTQNKNDGDHKQKEVRFDNRDKQSKNSLYEDQPNEKYNMKQDDKRNLPSIIEHSHREADEIKNQPENMQINVSLSPNNDSYKMTQETHFVKNEVQQNNLTKREQKLYDEEQKVSIDNRKHFRRSNRRRNHRRNNDRNHKYIEQLDRSQYGDSTDDKYTQHSLKKEVNLQINRNSRNIYKQNEHIKNKSNKHIPHKSPREKKVQVKYEHSEQSNEQSHNVHKTYESGRKKSPNKRKRKLHPSEESVIQKINKPEKQSNDDNSLYTQNINEDTTTDKVIVKRSTLPSTEADHQRHIRRELNKKVYVDDKQSHSDNQNNNNFSNNINGDTTDDRNEGDHNEDDGTEEYKDQKSQYLDSMDNEDFEKFDGRRMNRPSNDTHLAKELDVHDDECNNSQRGCFGEEYKKHNKSITENVQELTSLTAKYKLLKWEAQGAATQESVNSFRSVAQKELHCSRLTEHLSHSLDSLAAVASTWTITLTNARLS